MPECLNRLVLGTVLLSAGLLCLPVSARSAGITQDFAQIERGRYLTIAGDCAACHDDPYQHRAFAGGRPIETPFGVVVAPNITPDRETGIGAYTDAQFEAAVREGRRADGKRLYPAMPYLYFTKISHDDVLAIRAYLNTVESVHHAVNADRLPFPFSVRTGMRVWDGLYFTAGEFQPDPSKDQAWNRGAYLVQGLGHCAACHTPKGMLGGDKTARELQGYVIQGWFAPELTSAGNTGLSNWSNQDLVDYLKTGHNRFAAASGPMAEEVADSSSRMNDSDLEAIATYLKDQRSESARAPPLSSKDPWMVAGAAIYSDLCSACHKADGSGVPKMIPNLAMSNSVAASDPTTLIRVVLEGAQSVATKEEPTAPGMPAFGWQLTDSQIAAVTTFIGNSWNHAAEPVTEHEVREERSSLASQR